VTVTSIIDIEVRDEQILKFVELMKQQREMVKQLPSEWRAAGGAIADVTGEMDELVALYRERTELSKKNREEDRKEAAEKAEAREAATAKAKEERTLAQEEREAERAARKEQAEADQEAADIARQREKAEEEHEKKIQAFWEKKSQQARAFAKDFGLGLIGMGAGLFGMERLANSVSNDRVAAQGLGVSVGQKKAFDDVFGTTLGLDSSFIGHVQDVQSDLNKRWQFAPLGLQREAETADNATLSVDVLKKLHEKWIEAGPQGHNTSWMDGNGISGFVNLSQWRTIGAQTPEQLEQAGERFKKLSDRANPSDPDQMAWQSLSEQLKAAGDEIEKVFVHGLAPLVVPLSHLSESVVRSISSFMGTAPLGKWMEDLGHGIEWLAKYLGSDNFQKDIKSFAKGVEDFFDEVEAFAKKIGALVDQASKALAWLGFGPAGAPNALPTNPSPGDVLKYNLLHPDAPISAVPVTPEDAKRYNKLHPDAPMPVPPPLAPSHPFNIWNPGSWLHHDADVPAGLTTEEQKKLGTAPMQDVLDVVRAIESGGRNDAVGPMTKFGTAKGPYQFLDDTWQRYGHGGNQFDPAASRRAAQEYLTDLEKKYDGDVPKALAAYNWGPGNLDKDIADNGGDWMKHAPDATRKYVHDAAQKIHVTVATTVNNQTGAQVAMSANAVRG
jgi:hypothetical protein